MLRLDFDHSSLYQVRFPRPSDREAVLALASSFIEMEQRQLAPTPYLSSLQTLLAQAQTLQNAINSGESKRLNASEAVKQYDEQAKMLIRQMVNLLRGHFMSQPARVTEWGLTLKQGTGNILSPQDRDERLAFLNSYIAKEESRPTAERFALPALAEVRTVRDTLRSNLNNRTAGQTEREVNIAALNGVLENLLAFVQAGLVHLLATRFNFTLSPALQEWGFEVVQMAKPQKVSQPEAVVLVAE